MTKLRTLEEQEISCECGGVSDNERCGGCRFDFFGKCTLTRHQWAERLTPISGPPSIQYCGYWECAWCNLKTKLKLVARLIHDL